MVLRDFVGVPAGERAQLSSVVCWEFPGEVITEAERAARATVGFRVVRVFAFFAGSWAGDGSAGELTRSSISKGSRCVGVPGRFIKALVLAGMVWERWIGALLLRLVTLGGSSSGRGDSDFSLVGRGGAMHSDLTGDEDSKLITSFRACDAGCKELGASDETVFSFAIAPDLLTPGLVTFAKLAIDG